MSDSNDPFAATPYVPRSERPTESDDSVAAPTDAEDPDTAPTDTSTSPVGPAAADSSEDTEAAAPSASDESAPDKDAEPAAPSESDAPASTPSAADESESPETQDPAPESSEPTTVAEEQQGHGFASEAPTVSQPVVPSASQPPPAEDPTPSPGQDAATPATPTASDSEVPEQFTHRFPEDNSYAAFGATAASGTSTQQFPAYSEQPEAAAPAKPRKKRGRTVLVAGAVILLGAASGVAGAAGYEAVNGDDSGVVNSLNTKDTGERAPSGAVEKVAQSVLPSVVQINVKGSGEAGSGTGIIISSDGQILTNNHVVEGAADSGTITVSFNDGSISRADILGRDPVTDLAVIKAKDKTGLTPAKLGSSSDLKVGQEVVAIGSPFGLESTVTSGIISALNRPVSSSSGAGNDPGTVFPAVQTDAAINPGNSGGPLVDLDGRVVAINSAIRTNGIASADAGSIGLGFAIPIDLAKNVSKHLVKGETVEHARIGITVGNSVQEDGITTVGAEVKDVTSGGAGDKAGIKKGDVVTALNGNAVNGADALVASIRGYEPGEKVKLTYLRDGKKQTTEVTLDSDGGKLGS